MQPAYRETRRRFFDHPAMRIEGAVAQAARNCRTPEVLTTQLQILLTLRGAFVYERASSHSLLTANQVLSIAPGDVSRDRFVDGNPLDYMLVTPNMDAIEQLVGERTAADMRRVRDTQISPASPRVQHAASAFWNLQRHASPDEMEVEESAVVLLAALFSSPPQRTMTGGTPSTLIGAAKELMGAGRERWSLTGLAAQLRVSPAYLTDLFRRHEGVSIARYLRRLRLSRALVELPQTEDIASLALDLGFASHAHFTTAFRTTYGETPSRYRERFRKRASRRAGTIAACAHRVPS